MLTPPSTPIVDVDRFTEGLEEVASEIEEPEIGDTDPRLPTT
jgi:hypothetical protein